MSDHLIAEANRHAKAFCKMTLPTTKPNDRDLAWYIEECVDLKKQLAMECAAKREHVQIACAEINELKVKAGFFEREIARLREALKRADLALGYLGIGRAAPVRMIARNALRKEAQP